MKSTSSIKEWLLLLLAIALTVAAHAQNINSPTKRGPLGTQVNTLSGNLYIGRTDMYIPARGFDLNMKFSYNSFLFAEQYGYGNGWTFAYNIKYSYDTTLGGRLILWGDGREDKYDSIPGGAYKSPKGFYSTLSQYQPGKYVLTELSGAKFIFDNAVHRRITRMEEPNGNFINFTYTDSLLTNMVNAAGQSIAFTYDPKGRLATLVDAVASPSRTFTYTYDASGNLKEVKDPLNGKHQYTYLVNGPMKSLADKNDNKVDIIYFSDMTIRELIGCNKRLSFSYDTTIQTTIVTDHVETGNQVTKYTYKTVDNLSWITSVTGNCCGFSKNFEYDDLGNPVKITDANGQVYTHTYDSLGKMLTATDPLGNVNTYTYTTDFRQIKTFKDPKGNLYTLNYDSKGNLTELVSPGNNIYTATYNASGDIITSTDPKGNVYAYGYDGRGNLATVSGPNGYTTTLSFDGRGNLLSFADARGNTATGEYDILSRLKKITDPLNRNIEFNYDAAGNLIFAKNKNNEISLFNYDASNRVVKITGPTGDQSSLAYDGMNNVLSTKNELGNETKFTYDKLNRLKKITDPEGNDIAYERDGNGNITSVGLANGRMIYYTYNKLNRLISIRDGDETVGSFTYDKSGNLVSRTNATGAIASAVYDQLNRITQVTDPLGNTTSFSYDKNSNVIAVTDREGHTRFLTYDSLDRVKTFTDNNGFVTSIGYDGQSNIISLTDQNNNTTTYTYDELNRRKRMVFPDGKYKEFSYDIKGNISSIRSTDASVITYQYDSLNRITSRTLPDGEIYGFTYDKLGRALTASNRNGTVTFTYDKLNRVTSESFDGRTTTYSYNITGRTQTTIYPDNTTIIREYDLRNRLIKILKNGVVLVQYAYNNANQLTQQLFANGVSSIIQYDFANRLSSISTLNGTVQNTTFAYDKQYNKTSITRSNNPALSEQFTYDNGYRLTNYKRGPAGSPVSQNSYAYDAVGNRTSANLNGTTTTYSLNNLNQLTGANGTNYTFDDKGNLTYDGIFYKTYDAENRLIKDSSSPVSVVAYTYDALNRRITKSINGYIYKYTYSGATQIEERNNSNVIINRTVYNGFLSPLMNEKNGDQFYYHPNELGSVEAITNNNGRLVESYRYDVYGKLSRYDSLNNPLASSIAGNRFGFTGQEYDSTTGSYRFFYRSYSPETGVFHQRDLIEYGDGMGMYQYVGNNPSNGIDIWGLEGEADMIELWRTNPELFKGCKTVEDRNAMMLKRNFENLQEQEILREEQRKGREKVEAHEKVLLETAETIDHYGDFKNSADPIEWMTKGLPGPIDGVLTVIGGAANVVKSGNSFSQVSMKGSAMENYLHLADGVKNGAAALADGTAVGNAVAGNLPAAAAAKATSWGIWGVDKGSYYYFLAITSGNPEWRDAAQLDDLRSHYSVIGTKHEERYFGQKFYATADELAYIARREKIFDEYMRMQEQASQSATTTCELNDNPGTRKRLRVRWDAETETWVYDDEDPNLIVGPDGKPGKKWVSVKERMPYTIFFENDTTATAKVRYIKITAPIHPKQDPVTLQLGSFGFNNQSFEIPVGTSFYSKRLDCRDSTGLFVDITAGYDMVSNQLFWEFQGIDPLTLLPPEDPLVGFLFLPDTTQPQYGHGFVNFDIKPISSAQTLDTIGAQAFIVFGTNAVIPTNIHTNTIDALPPTSQLNTATVNNNTITLDWTGHDDAGGSGIDYYTVYVSTDQVSYAVLFPKVMGTDTTFNLPPLGTDYCFFVLATDRVGHSEVFQTGLVKCASITGVPLPVTWLYFNGTTMDKDNVLKWGTANEQNSKEFRLERSLNGTDYVEIAVLPAAGNSSSNSDYSYVDRRIDRLNSRIMFYRLKQVDMDGRFKYSSIVRLHYRSGGTAPTIIYPNPTKENAIIVLGDPSLIGTEASIMDINGRVLQRVKFTAGTQQINLQPYINGVYLIRLSNNETLKVIKQ